MMQHFRDQAERFGTRFVTDEVDPRRALARRAPSGVHRVWVGDDEYRARAVILAMGAEPRKLGVPGEEELAARGVSYCATCDAAFFRDRSSRSCGGGDTAMEEAIFLDEVRLDGRRSSTAAPSSAPRRSCIDRAREIENIEFVTPYVIDRLRREGDDGALEKVVLQARRDRRGRAS